MKLKLVEKRDEAKGTKSFFFEPEREVNWLPGQYFYYTLPNIRYPDARGATRHFTISSSPTEGKVLRLTTRIRQESGYKKSLDELKINDEVEGEGPNGTFILDENQKGNYVLIAGGIGITPFRSFIKYNIDNKLSDTKLHLIYSNSIPEEIAFRKDLENWSKSFENIKVEMTVSHPEESREVWSGLVGRVDEQMLKKLIGNWKLEIGNLTFWLCGPPPMVEAMEKVLGSLKITSDKVISEKFTGY
ncbi:MAG: Oxidoreductase FAD/NAD(P)-binding family protein [Candidatus Woesebacteria bacterium GW2011_GWA1_39_12]|uniref:Oxidoreductase FAD/NAD(P)-binding family protein n=1 Tax=Candidatus Woesebacteria bacterium GW2011_GWA1_39_12 TaxID=1618549 RepID=A0A0G0Q7Y4_9BACT|nr:MAG: Oxidoreductase FAD/NAD(P)-binding family protein [Candidatus Woesebacteria bacterium GW2011_GWA1_39_12]